MTAVLESPIATAEFFAGIGLMAAGLETRGFEILWANDIELAKHNLYMSNRPHSGPIFRLGDVRSVEGYELPKVEVATASFPCIDLSLAGNRRGLSGAHSGMFWEFARVIEEMNERRPRAVLLENVHGFATSHEGQDIRAALRRLADLGYSSDVFAINAKHFVPQSRPRMFIVGIRDGLPASAECGYPPASIHRPSWVRRIYAENLDLPMHYMRLPDLPEGPSDLSKVVQRMRPTDTRWWDEARRAVFLESLSSLQMRRLDQLMLDKVVSWRTAYRRTRQGLATWEIRNDGIAGCLRTTGGGSSRQALVEAGRGRVRVRWMTPLECARLMGAGTYKTGAGSANQALFGFGDAVVVDVVTWIADNYLVPTLRPR